MNIAQIYATFWGSAAMTCLGLVTLIMGGESLVFGAVKLARRLGMSSLLIGLTIVAFGTSLPEMFVSLTASLEGYPDIMIGNIVGSNIANIGLIFGISILIYPLKIHYHKIALELRLVIIASILVAVIAAFGFFYRFLGLVFVGGLISYTIWAYLRTTSKNQTEQSLRTSTKQGNYTYLVIACIGGLVLLAIGSDVFIKGAVNIARYFGVSELIIGLTLAALGTSLPELATCFSAIRRRKSDIVVGNVVGSNFFNLLMVMGGTATLSPFAISKDVLYRDIFFMLGFTLVLFPMLKDRGRLKRWQGGMLLIAYALYIYLLSR